MRFSNLLLGAALTGLAVAGLSGGALAQAPANIDPDAKIQLDNPTIYRAGIAGLDQRGCDTSDKVMGRETIEVDGYRYGGCLARGADKNLDNLRVLIKATQATGQYRNVAYGFAATLATFLVLGDTSANWRMEGSGTWNGEPAKVRLDFDYRVPGVRLFVTKPDGTQDITVVADSRKSPTGRLGHLEQPELFGAGPLDGVKLAAWKEKPMGVYSGPATMAPEDVLALAYLLPSGVILAGRDAADKIKASRIGRNDILTIPVPDLNGAILTARLDATGLPTHTELEVGGKKYVGDFGLFVNDRMDMEVKAPHQVKIQVDGKPLADLEIDFHHIGPYLVFPVPPQVAAK